MMCPSNPAGTVDAVIRQLRLDTRNEGVRLFISVHTGVAEMYFASSDIAAERERDVERYLLVGTYLGAPQRLDILRDLLASAITRLELLRCPPVVRHHRGAAHE